MGFSSRESLFSRFISLRPASLPMSLRLSAITHIHTETDRGKMRRGPKMGRSGKKAIFQYIFNENLGKNGPVYPDVSMSQNVTFKGSWKHYRTVALNGSVCRNHFSV